MDIKTYYNQQSNWDPAYFDWKISHYRANQAVMRSFDWISWQNKRVLDIGCGQGFYSIPVASRCERLVGFDLSDANIEIASKHAARLGLNNAKFFQSNLFDFVPDQPFDIAYAITVLMHIQNIPESLSKISTFIKPGGLLLISDLNRYFHRRLFPIRRETPYFYRTFSFKELRRGLNDAGFCVVHESGRIYSLGGKRRPEWMVSLALENWAGYWPFKYLGEHIAILAKKIT